MSPSPTGTRGVEPGPRASGRSPASPRAKTPPLLVADQLLDAMHDAGVTYCHWKSNEHVAAGLRGLTDLDLLVDRRQAMQAQAILTRTGFKRFTPAAGMGYPAIEDYIALDAATGRLLHCHLHYRLVAGEAHLKGYRLPWEDAFLEHRRWDAAGRLYVADPNLELLALLARFVTKLGPLHVARHLLGRPLVAHGWLHEYPWLRERIDVDRCTRYAGELLGEEAAGALSALLAAPLSSGRQSPGRSPTPRGSGPMGVGAVVREASQAAGGMARPQPRHGRPRRPLPPGADRRVQRRPAARRLGQPFECAVARAGALGGRAVPLGRALPPRPGNQAAREPGECAGPQAGHRARRGGTPHHRDPRPRVRPPERCGRRRRGPPAHRGERGGDADRMESHLVEFAGLPGSGKSAVSQALAALLERRGVAVSTPRHDLDHRSAPPARLARKVAYALAGALRQPGRAGRWLGTAIQSGQPSLGVLCAVAANWLQLGEIMRRCVARPGVHLFDEGLLQGLWSAGYEARAQHEVWPQLVRCLEEVLPPRLVVIVMDAAPAQVRQRLKRRAVAASRLDRDLARGKRDAAWLRAVTVWDDVLTTGRGLAGAHRLTLHRIHNEGQTPEEAAVVIAALIRPESASLRPTPPPVSPVIVARGE